ncbi:MAG: hypothetical protein K2Q45_06835 [Nitrosomonas sp.]|nr:hypothetical protein [Nitrosomonas sp.]
MEQVYRVFVQWLVHESDSEWDFYSIVYVGQNPSCFLSLVALASVNKWSRKYLLHFYKKQYKAYAQRLRRYQNITAWYDALREVDLTRIDINDDIFFPMYQLVQLESNIDIASDCEQCMYQRQKERWEFHNMCCEDNDCYLCQEIEDCLDCQDELFDSYCEYHRSRRRYIGNVVYGQCTCKPFRLTTDWEMEQALKQHIPVLHNQGWHMAWSEEKGVPRLELIAPGDRDDECFLHYSDELALKFYGE